jgi:hypothetical protein
MPAFKPGISTKVARYFRANERPAGKKVAAAPQPDQPDATAKDK